MNFCSSPLSSPTTLFFLCKPSLSPATPYRSPLLQWIATQATNISMKLWRPRTEILISPAYPLFCPVSPFRWCILRAFTYGVHRTIGPLSVQGFNGLWRLYTEPMYWLGSVRTLTWWRNQIVAPLSEEWTFRACMLPLLLQCFTPTTAIFVCPLFFGVAHFHHVVDKVKAGVKLKHALFISCFQFTYTTLFGAYAAFLFAKTGHLAAPFTAHSFCNHMGFPDLSEVVAFKDPLKRAGLFSLFVIGLVAWCFLLTPMTNPTLFHNNLFWHKHFI
ncbi:ras converting CAAX endopeptidase Sras isoform X3 [Megachile rotundata]|uniref:ras converting CAAX endopeptidase Sras isoform X3 n=1 Tax=Megachile rotundata TaxID=143995 RepID=UPI003FD02F0C